MPRHHLSNLLLLHFLAFCSFSVLPLPLFFFFPFLSFFLLLRRPEPKTGHQYRFLEYGEAIAKFNFNGDTPSRDVLQKGKLPSHTAPGDPSLGGAVIVGMGYCSAGQSGGAVAYPRAVPHEELH